MPDTYPWQLTQALDVFFFDCDSTLSLMEGIDVLAGMNNVSNPVRQITERCMERTGMRPEDYRARLDLVRPSQTQVAQLARHYGQHVTPGVVDCVHVLHQCGKTVYVISAGIRSAVSRFAAMLGIDDDKVIAVDVFFDDNGDYQGFDEKSPMVQSNGKSTAIASLLADGQRAMLVGDGMSDWEAHEVVTRFVGYGGLHAREEVRRRADFFINGPAFYSVLPLGLTADEAQALGDCSRVAYRMGLNDMLQGKVLINNN